MKCPICKSKRIIMIQDRVWDTDKRKVYQCKKCEIIFLYPMMKGKELKRFYKYEYSKYSDIRSW